MSTVKFRVFHDLYGCDTGCCGHYLEIDIDGHVNQEFEFDHPNSEEDFHEWAKKKFLSHIQHYAPDCVDSIDWKSLDISFILDYDHNSNRERESWLTISPKEK